MKDHPENFSDLNRRRAGKLARSAAISEAGDDFLMRPVIDDLIERLGAVTREFNRAAALFGQTSYLADKLEKLSSVRQVIRVEESRYKGLADVISTPETLRFAEQSFDLIAAPFGLHWSSDLPGSLIQIRRALKPDGLFLGVLPGGGTLGELRESLLTAESELTGNATQRVDAFTDTRDAGSLLQRAGFALPVTDTDRLTVRYGMMFDLIADLRRMGVTFVPNKPASIAHRFLFLRAAKIYAERFSDPDGRIRATFSFVSMSGWAPHDNQQKPLRPGSAKTRLADALKTTEKKL